MRALRLFALLSLTGCASTVTLYPTNPSAQGGGVLKATMHETDLGAGPIKVVMPGGEVLAGRYRIDPGMSLGYGNFCATAFGRCHRPFSNGFGVFGSLDARSVAIADLAGRQGTTMHCEVLNNSHTGHGDGTCRTSTGASYQVHY